MGERVAETSPEAAIASKAQGGGTADVERGRRKEASRVG
jgi:hypothetical protein